MESAIGPDREYTIMAVAAAKARAPSNLDSLEDYASIASSDAGAMSQAVLKRVSARG